MISVRGLEHRYRDSVALRVPEWTVPAGGRALIVGRSGSGKSTLLHILAALQQPSAGSVSLFGVDVAALQGKAADAWRGRHVGIVLQALHLVAHLDVRRNLRLAQYLAGVPQDDRAVDEALAALGVADKAGRRPEELSQGERQRVAIARAVVNRPKLLLADEPTANLDDEAAALAVELLAGQAGRTGATLVVATHDARVKRHFDAALDLSR